MDSHKKGAEKLTADYDVGNANLSHLRCDTCVDTAPFIKGKFKDWGLVLCCTPCSKEWIVCTLCKGRARLTTPAKALTHYYHSHSKDRRSLEKRQKRDTIVETTATSTDVEDEFVLVGRDSENEKEDDSVKSDCSGWLDVTALSSLGFENNSSCMRYFKFSSSRQKGMPGRMCGIQYLVKRFQLQTDLQTPTIAEGIFIPDNQLELQMNIARLAFEHSSIDRDFLAKVLQGAYQLGCENGYYAAKDQLGNITTGDKTNSSIQTRAILDFTSLKEIPCGQHANGIRIPKSANDIRILIEGKHSIIENLALPQIMDDVNDHAYVSVIECLRHFCAHEESCFESIDEDSFPLAGGVVRKLPQSQKAREMLDRARALFRRQEGRKRHLAERESLLPKFVIPIVFWGDDCDPGSTSMQGRANVWVKTMTIVGPNNLHNTYPIAIGSKDACHDAIEARINKDLAKLRSTDQLDPFYFGSKNRLAHSYFETLLILGDQPERRGQNYFSHGNGAYGARFLASGNHIALYDKLKSCPSCQQVMARRFEERQWELPIENCQNCLNWDVLSPSHLTLTELPKHYPVTQSNRIMHTNGKMYLKTFQITYASMRAAIDCAHTGYCEEGWTSDNCTTFLKVEGLNTDIIARFQRYADRTKLLKEATGDLRTILEKESEEDPKTFQPMPYPPQWERPGLELSDNIEAIMHELFLGTVKQVMKTVQTLLTRRSKNEAFIRLVQRQLEPLLDMSTDWMKCRQYKGGKFSGFVSENYLAYARIASWMYQNVDKAMPDRDVHKNAPPPEKTNHKLWTVAELKYWLTVRGLDNTGIKTDLFQRVVEAMMEDPPPEPLPLPDVQNEDIERLITAMSNMLECCMSHHVTPGHIRKLDYAIRIFISALDRIDTELRPAKAKPSVITCYNIPCLMNLPNVMETFGPLPSMWEGKVQGEGYLPQVKLTYYGGMMRHSKWQYHMLRGLYRRKAFDNLKLPKITASDFATDFSLKAKTTKFHQHTSPTEVMERINELRNVHKAPVSVLILNDIDVSKRGTPVTRIFSVCGFNELLVEIACSDNTLPRHKFGLDYHQFDVVGGAFSLEDDSVPLSWEEDIAKQLVSPTLGFGYLLPLLEEDDNRNNRMFTLIASNWKRLHRINSLNDLLDMD